jgi:hypothetical protein
MHLNRLGALCGSLAVKQGCQPPAFEPMVGQQRQATDTGRTLPISNGDDSQVFGPLPFHFPTPQAHRSSGSLQTSLCLWCHQGQGTTLPGSGGRVQSFNPLLLMGHDDAAAAAAGLALTIHHTHAQGMEPLQQQDGEGVGGPMYLLPPDAEGNDAEDDKLVSPPFDFPQAHTYTQTPHYRHRQPVHTHTPTSSYQSSIYRPPSSSLSTPPAATRSRSSPRPSPTLPPLPKAHHAANGRTAFVIGTRTVPLPVRTYKK